MAGQGGTHEGDQGPDGQQASDGEGLTPQSSDINVQPSLEKDHRHGEPHHVVHGVTQNSGIDDPH